MARDKLKTKMCPAEIACDGALTKADRTMCYRCEDALMRRQKVQDNPKQSHVVRG
jgi:hypothetical protein